MQSAVNYRESELPAKRKTRGGAGHFKPGRRRALPYHHSPPRNAIGRSLAVLFPSGPASFYQAAVDLLQGKSNRQQVRDWYRGKSKPPAWALQLIEAELRKRMIEMQQSIDEFRSNAKKP